MADLTLRERFPIDPRQVSTRLFFAKTSEFDPVWHICDAALGSHSTGTGALYTALHGSYMHVEVKVDTVLQADLRRKAHESMCAHCLDEFMLAIDDIKGKHLLKFK